MLPVIESWMKSYGDVEFEKKLKIAKTWRHVPSPGPAWPLRTLRHSRGVLPSRWHIDYRFKAGDMASEVVRQPPSMHATRQTSDTI
jgi:hypothetical protein